MNNYHILYTADHQYFSHMLTSIYSLMENNNKRKITVHIIEDQFTEEDNRNLDILNDLYSNLTIKRYSIHKLDKLMDPYHLPKWRGSDVTNARLFAHEIIEDTDKLLYLDSDTIIVDSLDELFSKKTTSSVSAVKEIEIPNHIKEKVSTYYNSGVILFDYDLWEQEDCFSELYTILRNADIELIYPDQDLLNLALSERITPLSPTYNIYPAIEKMKKHPLVARKFYHDHSFYTYKEIKEALAHPHILHNLEYLHSRAWKENIIHPFNEEYELYRSIWDPSFEREPNDDFLANTSITPYLNMMCKSFFPEKVHQKIKQRINKKT